MRNLFNLIAFLFLGFALAGCYDMHGYVPVTPMADAGPFIGGDAGPMVVVPDTGPVTSDSGPVILADSGSDAFVPPTEDAGSDAGSPPEPDAGSDAGIPGVDAGPMPSVVLEVTHYVFSAGIAQPYAVPRRNFGSEELCARGGDVVVSAMGVHLYGDAATYTDVALDTGRGLLANVVPPPGVDQHLTITLDHPLMIEDGTCVIIIRMASLASVESRPSEATDPGHAYSGLPAGVDLDLGSEPGEWSDFAGRWHIHATDTAGEPVYAVAVAAPFYPDVVRLGRPFVYTNYGDVSASTTNSVRTTLFRPLFSANSLGRWSLRQFAVLMTDNDAAWAPGACLHSFRFQYGSVELPMGEYQIVDDAGNDLRSDTACYRPVGPANHVWIEFTSELVVSPEVTYHALTAIPDGFAAGDAIRSQFTAFNSTVPVTGCLEDAPDFGTWLRPIHSFGGITDLWRPAFLWSDLSQAAHSATPGSSSCDWTDEVYAMFDSAVPPRTVTIVR